MTPVTWKVFSIYIIGVGWTNKTDEPIQKEKEEVCNFK
mgnify:FL=1